MNQSFGFFGRSTLRQWPRHILKWQATENRCMWQSIWQEPLVQSLTLGISETRSWGYWPCTGRGLEVSLVFQVLHLTEQWNSPNLEQRNISFCNLNCQLIYKCHLALTGETSTRRVVGRIVSTRHLPNFRTSINWYWTVPFCSFKFSYVISAL